MRAAFTTFFGNRWQTQWAQAGFVNGSTAIPETIDDRIALALRVVAFLVANPGFEVPNVGVSASNGTIIRDAALESRKVMKDLESASKDRGTERDVAVTALTSLMRLLIGTLAELLNADDPRWLAFGLEIPRNSGCTARPQRDGRSGRAPTGWQQHAPSDCDVGPDTARDALSAADADPWAGSGLPPRQQHEGADDGVDIPTDADVEFFVQAVNRDRQSVASEPVVHVATVTKPVGAVADTVVDSVAPIAEALLSTNGSNGHRNGSNGHANGSRSHAQAS